MKLYLHKCAAHSELLFTAYPPLKSISVKRLVVLILLVLLTRYGFAQSDSTLVHKFELKGSLIDTVALAPHCGIFAWATVVEFRIIDISNPNYTADSIGIIVTCPSIYGEEFFEKGKVYKLQLINQNTADFGWIIPNEAVLSKYALNRKLWATEIEKLD